MGADVGEAVSPRWLGFTGSFRVVDRVVRGLALLVLAAGFVGLCSFLFPRDADTSEFLRDARSGEIAVVDVLGSESGRARVAWSTGFLQDKELSYPVDPLEPASQQFATDMQRRLGPQEGEIAYRERGKLEELGVLDLLIPVMYWRVMPHFALAVLICCVGICTSMIFRAQLRSISAGYWLVASVVFGFGFPAYLWSEPEPLVRFRKRSAEFEAESWSGWRVTGGVLSWLLVGSALAFAIARR